MDKKSFGVMLKLYLDPDFTNGEITKEYLKSSGIDAEAFKEKMLNILDKKLAELRYEKGEKLREEYIKALQGEKADTILYEDDLQFAFRKLEKLDKEDISDIEKDKIKMEILKKLAEKKRMRTHQKKLQSEE
jgi:hypothetical protein